MADIGEAVFAGHFGGPGLDLTALHLDGAAAGAAHQVVVMVLRAAPVDRLAGVGAQRVDQPGRRHRLQRAVHGGQADALAAAAQFVVQFLGGAEVVEVLQQREIAARCRVARTPAPALIALAPRAAWVTAATTMSAR